MLHKYTVLEMQLLAAAGCLFGLTRSGVNEVPATLHQHWFRSEKPWRKLKFSE